MPTVAPADIRGLVTTLLVSVGRLPHSRGEGRPKPPLNAFEGCTKPGPRLCSESEVHVIRLHFDSTIHPPNIRIQLGPAIEIYNAAREAGSSTGFLFPT